MQNKRSPIQIAWVYRFMSWIALWIGCIALYRWNRESTMNCAIQNSCQNYIPPPKTNYIPPPKFVLSGNKTLFHTSKIISHRQRQIISHCQKQIPPTALAHWFLIPTAPILFVFFYFSLLHCALCLSSIILCLFVLSPLSYSKQYPLALSVLLCCYFSGVINNGSNKENGGWCFNISFFSSYFTCFYLKMPWSCILRFIKWFDSRFKK